MAKTLTVNDFINRCNDNGVTWFNIHDDSLFNGMTSNFPVTCKQCGWIVNKKANSVCNGKSMCPICGGGRVYNLDEWLNRLSHNHHDRYVLYDFTNSIYTTCINKMEIRCVKCDTTISISPDHIDHGHGCRRCFNIRHSQYMTLTLDEFITKSRMVHGDRYEYILVQYIDSETKICIICPEHGIFWQTPHNHLSGKGCPICRSSHGERDVQRWLSDHNIKHDMEHTYLDLVGVNGGLLRFDFYLPDTNTCIEFDGEQHYKYISSWFSVDRFNDLLEHDKRKNEYCDKHNIHLIRIRYDDDVNDVLTTHRL